MFIGPLIFSMAIALIEVIISPEKSPPMPEAVVSVATDGPP